MNSNIFKSPWLLAALAALAIFALCFVAINYVSRPDGEKGPDVKKEVIATMASNPELIAIARQQGWIGADATEMTSIDAAQVTDVDSVFAGSPLKSFDEFRYFVRVKTVKPGAFSRSSALRSIVVPAYVEDIGYGAFAHCPALESLRVDSANTHYDSRRECNAVICTWKGKLMVVAGCRNTVVPADVRYIAPQAFCGSSIEAIALPERMEEIGEEAFRDCARLEAIEITKGVHHVNAATFSGCTALKSVVLPKSIDRLHKQAFAGCTSLQTIVCPKQFPPIVDQAFDDYGATVVVPRGQRSKYSSKPGWKKFRSIKESD